MGWVEERFGGVVAGGEGRVIQVVRGLVKGIVGRIVVEVVRLNRREWRDGRKHLVISRAFFCFFFRDVSDPVGSFLCGFDSPPRPPQSPSISLVERSKERQRRRKKNNKGIDYQDEFNMEKRSSEFKLVGNQQASSLYRFRHRIMGHRVSKSRAE